MLLSSLLPVFCNSVRKCVYSASPIASNLLQPANNWAAVSLRTVVRYHFPRPSERKRVQRHGWVARMSTANGRRIIMRRILKGRHVLTH